MASPNRHWPSMFRSNPSCNIQQQQQQPDTMNNRSSIGNGSSSSPGFGAKPSLLSSGCEESTRSTEPKPRWNPRPEQIRILEGIFNAGMVNPPRDEIRRIRMQLQEYGQVGDANVFYWFQNRKSRTKNKLRAAGYLPPGGRAAISRAPPCNNNNTSSPPAPAPVTPPRSLFAHAAPVVAPTSSSSSSSDRSSGSSKSVMKPPLTLGMPAATPIDLLSPPPPPALPAYQLYYHSHPTPAPPVLELTSPEQLLLQWPPQNHYLPATELGGILGSQTHTNTPFTHAPAVSPAGVLLGLSNDVTLGQEMLMDMSCCSKGFGSQYLDINTTKTDALSTVIMADEKARLGLLHYGLGIDDDTAATPAPPPAAPVHAAVAAADVTNAALLTDHQLQMQGLLDVGLLAGGAPPPPTATVVAVVRDGGGATCSTRTTRYSVPAMTRLDVKLFGVAAVLFRHNGEQVLVDESGVTVEPLQQGALYYVLASTN